MGKGSIKIILSCIAFPLHAVDLAAARRYGNESVTITIGGNELRVFGMSAFGFLLHLQGTKR